MCTTKQLKKYSESIARKSYANKTPRSHKNKNGGEKMSAGVVVQQMIVIFFVVLVGYICYKKKIIQENASKSISALILRQVPSRILAVQAIAQDKL